MEGGMLWRNGRDGKALRCGAGERQQHTHHPPLGHSHVRRMTWQPEGISGSGARKTPARNLSLAKPALFVVSSITKGLDQGHLGMAVGEKRVL